MATIGGFVISSGPLGSIASGIPSLRVPGGVSVSTIQGFATTASQPKEDLTQTVMKADTIGKAESHVYPWGIYQKGDVVVAADSVVSFEYRREWHVADFPQEAGAFASYNKVGHPFDVRVSMSKGGTESERSYFLATIESVAASLDLYEVWTPERTYLNVNIARVDYRRTARQGAGLITVDLWLVEIRATATAMLSGTKTNSGASTVSLGIVQPQTPTAAQSRAVAGGR